MEDADDTVDCEEVVVRRGVEGKDIGVTFLSWDPVYNKSSALTRLILR